MLYLDAYEPPAARAKARAESVPPRLSPTVVAQEAPADVAAAAARGAQHRPRRSLLCYPEEDQLLLVPGELSHGVLDGAPRRHGGGSDGGGGAIAEVRACLGLCVRVRYMCVCVCVNMCMCAP